MNLGKDELIVNIACNSFIFWMVLILFYSATKANTVEKGKMKSDSMLSLTPSDQLHTLMHVHVSRDVKFVFTFNMKKTDGVIFLYCFAVLSKVFADVQYICLMK